MSIHRDVEINLDGPALNLPKRNSVVGIAYYIKKNLDAKILHNLLKFTFRHFIRLQIL